MSNTTSSSTNHLNVNSQASDNEKTPYEMWEELRDLVADLEKDAQKATRGMKAGGVRLRTKLQDVRQHCVEMRKVVLEFRSTRRPRGQEGSDDNGNHGARGADELALAESAVASNGSAERDVATASSHFAPQPGQNSWFEAGSSRHSMISRSA